MPKFTIDATRTHWYTIEVEAEDEEDAYDKLNDWISDDFEPYETNAEWKFGVFEMDEDENE